MLVPTPVAPVAKIKLDVQGVSKRLTSPRAKVQALDNVSLNVADGEFVCLVGPSGCGKTTLLDIIAGLTKPDAGRALADGQSVEGPGHQRLVMFQESALFPWLTVFGNVMFGLKLREDLTSAERRRVAHTSRIGRPKKIRKCQCARALRRNETACGACALFGA